MRRRTCNADPRKSQTRVSRTERFVRAFRERNSGSGIRMVQCTSVVHARKKYLARAGSRRQPHGRETARPEAGKKSAPSEPAARDGSISRALWPSFQANPPKLHFKSDPHAHRRSVPEPSVCFPASPSIPTKPRHELSKDICGRLGPTAARLRLAHVRRQPPQTARPPRGTDRHPTPNISNQLLRLHQVLTGIICRSHGFF